MVRIRPDDTPSHVHIGMESQQERREPVPDVDRQAPSGERPVPGAQWDEVHRRWERWDPAARAWVVVGDPGDDVEPAAENPLPALLARELRHADELDLRAAAVVDIRGEPEPAERVPGAQWNEVVGRWERWDEAAGAWVAAEESARP